MEIIPSPIILPKRSVGLDAISIWKQHTIKPIIEDAPSHRI